MADKAVSRVGSARAQESVSTVSRRGRRRDIIDAAFDCLAGTDPDLIRIDDVARVAGVAKATLYRHFPSKEILYSIVLRQWVDDHQLRTISAVGLERARIRARSMIEAFEEQPQFFKLSVTLFSSTDPAVKAQLSGVAATTQQYFVDDLSTLTEVAPSDAATIVLAVVHSAAMSSVYHGVPFAAAYRLVDQVIGLLTDRPLSRSTPRHERTDGGDSVRTPVAAELPAYKRRRRDRIVEEATSELRESRYEQIRVSDIASRADVALGTFYRYFPSKEALYAEVLRQWFLTSGFTEPLDDVAPGSRVAARIGAAVDAFEADPEFFRVNVLLHSVGGESVQAVLGDVFARARAMSLADLCAARVPDPDDVATMTWSLLSSLTMSAIAYGRSFSEVRRVMDTFAALVISRADERLMIAEREPR